MLLNDVHREEQRLAYLLGLTTERHVPGGTPRLVARVAVLGAVVLFLLSFWLIFSAAEG